MKVIEIYIAGYNLDYPTAPGEFELKASGNDKNHE